MLIKRPIFINGFQRGGTNILQQLFASNPRVRGLGVEVHELFYGRDAQPVQKWLRRLAAAPVVLATRQHTFWPYRFYPRRPLPAAVGRYVDLLLYLQKQTAVVRTDGDGAPAWAERRQARALCKCVNGVVLATPLFTTMYPDATFVALVRHGLALCEGFVRRGWSAQRAGQMYRTVGQQMLADAARHDTYHLVHFETLLADPAAAVRQVYGLAGLDVAETPAFRLQAKKSMGQNGQRGYTFGQQNKALIWCELADLRLHLRQDVNANQIARLSAADRAAFLAEAGEVMAALGYEPDAPMPVRAAAADVERAGVSRLRQAQAAAVNEETR